MLEKPESYYDIIAEAYPELHREEQLRKFRIISSMISPKPGETLLDVGCGPCYSAEVFKCFIAGVDPSVKLLEKAPRLPNLKLVRGYAEQLPFQDCSFDYVISVTAIHNFSDIPRAVHEIWRVSKSLAVVSCLIRSKALGTVKRELSKRFTIEKQIVEGRDIIFLLKKV
ncbi:MAG: methyltransferase domain-containing protein [Candidatus Woesearchaeota archaeon]